MIKPVLRSVPCGKCPACLSNNRQRWTIRLVAEFEYCVFGSFVTLTYDDLHLPSNGVNKRDCQLFLKRLRKLYGDRSFRYFLCSEYGDTTHRPHYHVLFFCYQGDYDAFNEAVFKSWANGFVKFGFIEPASIAYCTKYCMKTTAVPPGQNSTFVLMSRNPGIGVAHIQDYKEYYSKSMNIVRVNLHGRTAPMPRYYRDKVKSSFPDVFTPSLDKLHVEQQIKRYKRKYEAFLRKYRLVDCEDSKDKFLNFISERNLRSEELILKHIKNQKL